MKPTLAVLCAAYQLWASDYTVCASGCDYTTLTQTALNTLQPGDNLIFASGETFTLPASTLEFPNKAGADWITLKSSKAHLLPDGYRPAVGDTRLATLSTTYTGTQFSFGTDPSFTRACFSSTVAGNVVTLVSDASVGNPCEYRDTAGVTHTLTTSPCTVTLLGVAVSTSGTSGDQGTGLRVGLDTAGHCRVSHKSDIAETTQFTCSPDCTATGEKDTWMHFSFPENTVPITAIAYSTAGAVTGKTDKHNWLSGPVLADTTIPGLCNGTCAAQYAGPAAGSHHWRFEGLDFFYNSTATATYGTLFFKDKSYEYQYIPHDLEWDRCVFRQPKAGKHYWKWLYVAHGERIAVRNSRFLNNQTSTESSGVATIMGSQGPFIFENIEADGNENILSGGANFQIAGAPEISVTRSLFRKRLEQWPALRLVRQASTDTLALTTTDSSTRCNAGTCTAYYENTPYTYTSDSTIIVGSGISSSIFVGVSSAGVLTAGHNSGSDVTCSGSITCLTGVTSRANMADYAMLYEWTATSGVWASSSSWSYSSYFHKNSFELKVARDALISGNVFQNYWAAGGQYCQVVFTARNQNGMDVSSRLDGLHYTRNKNIGAHCGLSLLAMDDQGWNTFGRNWHFTHNVLADVSKSRWGNTTAGGYGISMGISGLSGVVVEHNTLDTSVAGFWQNENTVSLNSILFRNNLFLWNPNSLTGMGGDSILTWNSLRKDDTTPVASWGYLHPNSEYRGNLNLGTGTIPSSGWGSSWADYSTENFYSNQRVSSIAFSSYLTSISTPATLTDNFRISTASTKSVHNASYDGPTTTTGMDTGADLDWVETLTDGVIEGYPELAQRWDLHARRTAGTTATVELWNTTTVTVKVSTHQNMKAANVIVNTSTPTMASAGRKVFDLTGLTAGVRYWVTVTDGTKTWKGTL